VNMRRAIIQLVMNILMSVFMMFFSVVFFLLVGGIMIIVKSALGELVLAIISVFVIILLAYLLDLRCSNVHNANKLDFCKVVIVLMGYVIVLALILLFIGV